jgi:L-serine dehydratase
MGPARAAKIFKDRNPNASSFRVTLYDSLAATGKGHLTDAALQASFAPSDLEILWKPEEQLSEYPNGMAFEALDSFGSISDTWEIYSVGGGALKDQAQILEPPNQVYEINSMTEIMSYCERKGLAYWEFVADIEGEDFWDFLREVKKAMFSCIERGLKTEGVLPGGLGIARKAWSFFRKSKSLKNEARRSAIVSAYALAVSEENASSGVVVTAPTCGGSGVVPAILRYLQEDLNCDDVSILRALATAGIIGNLVKQNASISGAQVGCQGEVGVGCSMAAGAAAQLMGGTVRQIEYAASMAIEHNLGLPCDPVLGLVQIPCIERNAIAATTALACADYALFTDGSHRISFDGVVEVMQEIGNNLPVSYKETATGGLATLYQRMVGTQKDG